MISLGSGRARLVGAVTGRPPQRLYRVDDPDSPSRSTLRSHPADTVGRSSFQPFQTLQSGGGEGLPVSADSAAGVLSCRIRPVRSETDFGRPAAAAAAVYSSELHAPVNQFHRAPGTCLSSSDGGGPTTAGDNDQYDSCEVFWRSCISKTTRQNLDRIRCKCCLWLRLHPPVA